MRNLLLPDHEFEAQASINAMRSLKDVKLWGLVVTFQRPRLLSEMLGVLNDQTRKPDEIIVVDNGSDEQVRAAASRAQATYIDAGENLGPAGGIALGMEYILSRASEDDWVALFDDDDPPDSPSVIEQLFSFAHEQVSADPSTAAVGTVGARYDRRRGVFIRVPDEELSGPVSVDYIGGGHWPLYSCRAIQAVGVFDRSLFFGFEEADYGLRLRSSGYSLWVDGDIWRKKRERHSRLGMVKTPRTPRTTPSWRRYYSLRNAIFLAKRYGTGPSTAALAIVGVIRATASLLLERRPLRELALPIRAARDGLLGRTGRTIDPVTGRRVL